jgi:hypothetical protein
METPQPPRLSTLMTLAPALLALAGALGGTFMGGYNAVRLERERFEREVRQASVGDRAEAYGAFARIFQRLILDAPALLPVLTDLGFWEGEASDTPPAAAERTRLFAELQVRHKALFETYKQLSDAGAVIDFIGSDRAQRLASASKSAALGLVVALTTRGEPETIGSSIGDALNRVVEAKAAFDTLLGMEVRDLAGKPLFDAPDPVIDGRPTATSSPAP